MKRDFSKIRQLLESQETFPMEYVHKVIARNTPAFLDSLSALEGRFPLLRRGGMRPSASEVHLSVTLILHASTAEEVIRLLEATEELCDLVMVL